MELKDKKKINIIFMAEFIKWWKDKMLVLIILTAILSVVIAFLFAFFFEWGWIVSIIIALGGGYLMRRLIIKKLTDTFKE